MKVEEIRKIAKNMGLKNITKISKTPLIRTIQQSEGNPQCFAVNPTTCGQGNCLWLKDCFDTVRKPS